MDSDYEERSKRLMERLNRIQNYLQSVPPLPKIGSECSIDGTSELRRDLSSEQRSAGSRLSTGSIKSSPTRSVSTKQSRVIRKDSAGGLLQGSASRNPSLDVTTPDGSDSSTHVIHTTPGEKKKKKKRGKDSKIQDPLRPTSRKSFGLDIGQGINMINYIKQNAIPPSEHRNKRLLNIVTKDPAPTLHTAKSMERVYKQTPILGDSSSMSFQLKNKEKEVSKTKQPKHTGFGQGAPGSQSTIGLQTSSDVNKYRVRYEERAVELPHSYGLDGLQELFVPYMEHASYPEVENPKRNSSDYQ